MSSIQSFARQRVVGTRTVGVDYSQTSFAGNALPGTFYQFVPLSGNYVGNYPPGYMVENTVELQNNVGWMFNLNAVATDMGKTIKAVIGLNASTVPANLSTGAGYFREYQIIFPNITGLNGIVGSSSGIAGGPPATGLVVPQYFTVYIPIIVNGIIPARGEGIVDPIFNTAYLLSDGQL